jgi:hypothetical protein
MDNSLESMCDTFEDIKEMIDKSLDNYRRSNITLVKFDSVADADWRSIQISIGGTDTWRRLVIPTSVTLADVHNLIQALFAWSGIYEHCFLVDIKEKHHRWTDEYNNIKESIELATFIGAGVSEFIYEYGTHWTVKIMVLSVCNAAPDEKAHCTMGEKAAPPERVDGPLRFRRFISALDSTNTKERETARAQLGAEFKLNAFNLFRCNEQIKGVVESFKTR